jgi:hypothetical protein
MEEDGGDNRTMWCGGSPGRSVKGPHRANVSMVKFGPLFELNIRALLRDSGSPLPPLWSLDADFVSIGVSKNGDTITTQAGPFCLYLCSFLWQQY